MSDSPQSPEPGASGHGGEGASPWMLRFLPLIRPGGRVLDLAAGAGRHTRALLAAGHRVIAADRDVSRLRHLGAEAELVELDLETGAPWALGGGYDAILVANYLHRPLFPALLDALAPGGLLLYETFAAGNERFGKPSNPDFLLRPGELLDLARPRLRVVAFEEGEVAVPRPAVTQRIAARNVPAEEAALLRQLKALQAQLQREKRAAFDRRVGWGDLLTERAENARAYGFGEGSTMYDSALVIGDVRVGRGTWIGPNVVLDGSGGGLAIGEFCTIGAGVQIYTHHTVDWALSGGAAPPARKPTRIGSRILIGPNSVVQMGVTIGDGAVIGALSFVNRDIPPGARAFGSPVRIANETASAMKD